MNPGQFDSFVQVATWICIGGAVLNLLLFRRRGTSSLALAAAFIALAATILLVRFSYPSIAIVIGGLVVFVLLGLDFWLRSGKAGQGQ